MFGTHQIKVPGPGKSKGRAIVCNDANFQKEVVQIPKDLPDLNKLFAKMRVTK